MEASDDHMLNEQSNVRKMDSTVLDCFKLLADNNEKLRIEGGVKLLQHVYEKQTRFQGKEVSTELLYTLNRLVRGVASARINARKGFYSALVGLLSTCSFLTVKDILAVIKKELHSANTSKSEEADIYTGHILVYGAMIQSDLLFRGTTEELNEVFNSIVDAGSKRSYLLLLSHSFIVMLLNKVEEESFQSSIWPVLKDKIKSKPELTLEIFHLLLLSCSLHPDVIKKKVLLNYIGTPEIIHEESLQMSAKLLMTVRNFSDFYHPVHEEFCKQLSKTSLLSSFWEVAVEGQLEKLNESKKYVIVELFYFCLKHTEDKSQIPSMLTPRFVNVVLRSLEKLSKKLVAKTDRVCARTHEVFVNFMLTTALKDGQIKDKTIVKIIKKLTLSAGGDLMFDRITGTRVVQNLLGLLKAKGVKKLVYVYRDIISCTSGKRGSLDGEEPRPWSNKERMYAADLFARILGLPSVMGDIEWRTEQVQFLLHHGFFYLQTQEQNIAPINGLLADSLKQSFYRVLNQRLPKMEDVRVLLNALVQHVDEIIAGGDLLLRQPLTREVLDTWQKLIVTSTHLEQQIKTESGEMLTRVFHIMFLYMGLQLLTDHKLAQDALEELHGCFERIENEQKEKQKKQSQSFEKEEDEPVWVEVAVDLILSLLSQNSSIPKNMLDMFFFHLCPHLTGPALGQIIQVLDPTLEDSPLSNSWDKEEDESDENQDSDIDIGDTDSKESDSEESELDMEDENETVNDKLRMAVREALGSAASLTDTESVDIDDIDEVEGRRLDKALSEAFSMLKGSKSNRKLKKQMKDDRILMHFRIRAIDLLEIYLKSEHLGTEASLSSYIDIMLVLFSLLEFCIRDLHQKPLENRVRSCLKRLSSARKNVSVEGVLEETVAEALQRLMEKGEKTSGPIFMDMGPKIIECCTFLVRCSQRLNLETVQKGKEVKTSKIIEIYKNALQTFFTKRDCLHQPGLFRSVLEIVWDGNWSLVPLLIDFVFDSEIRPFRRNQAIDLLVAFFRNRRLRSVPEFAQNVKPKLAEIEKLLSDNTIKWFQSQTADNSEFVKSNVPHGVKQRFLRQLLTLLFAVWHSYGSDGKGGLNVDWTSIGNELTSYRERTELSADTRIAFNKFARILNLKWVTIPKEKKEANGNSENSSHNDKRKNEMVIDSDGDNESEEGNRNVNLPQSSNKEKNGKRKGNIKQRKREKSKKGSKDKAKLKKEARELRLASLSEGLENVTFTSLKRNVETDTANEVSATEKLLKAPNGLVNGENEKKSRVLKRTSDEVENIIHRTNKKVRSSKTDL